MASLNTFAARMTELGTMVSNNADKIVRTVALAADRNVVLATPVDTGRARSNWVVGIGLQNSELKEPMSAEEAIQEASSLIGQRKEGQTIYISNSLPYIGRLNEGSSAQASEFFVQTAVVQAVSAVKDMKVLSNGR